MGSNITGIYDALVAMSVTVSNKTPTVYGITGLPNTVATADLPVRIVEILGSNAMEGEGLPRTIGANPQISANWMLSDLLLWLPQAQGAGVKQVAQTLVEYSGLYIDAARAIRAITSNASIMSVSPVAGVYEYPLNSGILYYGVAVKVKVKEIIA